MEPSELNLLADKSSDVNEVIRILEKFLKTNEFTFSFPCMSTKDRQKLWSTLLELSKGEHRQIHGLCLTATRLLSRDKDNLEEIITEDMMSVLIEKAGYNDIQEAGQSKEAHNHNLIEVIKVLCNLSYNCALPRKLYVKLNALNGLVNRLRICNQFDYEIFLYDLKLLFLLTAFDNEAKTKMDIPQVAHYLTNTLKVIIGRATSETGNVGDECKKAVIDKKNEELICEVLKILFNLCITFSSKKRGALEFEVDESQERIFLNIIPVLVVLLNCDASNSGTTMNITNHVANLLTSLPYSFYDKLTPKLDDEESEVPKYEGYDMSSMAALLEFLQNRLADANDTNALIALAPILTVLIKASRGCRMQRKYLRSIVLPPLRDVSLPPEQGDALRNQLCRLLTTQVMSVRNLVAEFIFILCKEKVGRMVKYAGFGNAAGHLAQNGLLGGHEPSVDYSSSDDSDTEEYLEAQPNIDPVVGCTRPPRPKPFEGMSEEQKEYEAMKLVELLNTMTAKGVIRPARIGADGKPEAIEHVLQLQEK